MKLYKKGSVVGMEDNKKIGLVAVSNHNYGSQLQTYAMHQALLNLGVDNEIIRYKQNPIKQLKRALNPSFFIMKGKSVVRNVSCKVKYPEISRGLAVRANAFEKFKLSHCKYSPNISERNVLEQYVTGYKAVILGSDQVWHPANLEMDYFTLNFVPNEIPKIAYAPSFGVSEIPRQQKKATKEYLERFNAVSVREKSGAEIIRSLTGKNVQVVCDPTALLTREQWDIVSSVNKYTDDKYIFCYFLGSNRKHREFANKVKKITGYKIIALQHLDELVKDDIYFGDIKPYNVGPEDFVSLIANAEIVLTDSFHGTMFSIYYHKNFFTFSRFLENKKDSTNSRIVSILDTLDLSKRHYTTEEKPESCLRCDINWNEVDDKLAEFRNTSLCYLNEIIQKYALSNINNKDKSIENKKKNTCTGCTACVHSCPQNCIKMVRDYEGFLYPCVDREKCIKCGICSKICPVDNVKNGLKGYSFAARSESKNVRMTSSSGGMFNAIAKWILNRGGVVIGAGFDEAMQVKHMLIEKPEELKALQASKYVQSDLSNIFPEIRNKLEQGKYVFFCGTPCQAVGLKCFLKKEYDHLFIADVLCYGVPSPGVFSEFVKFMEKKHNAKLVDFYFRDKSFGYASPNVKAVFANGDVEQMTSDVKSFTKTFFAGVTTRPACFNCAFKTVDRETDITLGDFWTVEKVDRKMDDDTGATLLLVHTEKALKMIRELSDVRLTSIEYSTAISCAGPMLLHSAKPSINRDLFFKDLADIGYKKAVDKDVPDSLKNKVANVVKPILLKTGITKFGVLKAIKVQKIKNEAHH